MAGKRTQVFSGIGVPQADGRGLTPTGDGATIGTERNAQNRARMPGEQGDLLMCRRIVEPNTDTTSDRKSISVGRILYFIYPTFTEARLSPLR